MKSVAPTLGQANAIIIQDESQQVVAANMVAKTAKKEELLAMQARGLSLQAGRDRGSRGRKQFE